MGHGCFIADDTIAALGTGLVFGLAIGLAVAFELVRRLTQRT